MPCTVDRCRTVSSSKRKRLVSPSGRFVNAIGIGTVIGTTTIPGQSIHVRGVAGLGFKSGNLQIVDGHEAVVHIPQAEFPRVVDTACE